MYGIRSDEAPRRHHKVAELTDDRPTIVSLTPIPVDVDTRTYKLAASFERMGARSIVVEGKPSGQQPAPPFELISIGPRRPRAPVDRRNPFHRALTLAGTARELASAEVFAPWRSLPKADLYYLHSYRQYPGLLLRRGLRGTPIVYDAHDFGPEILATTPEDPRFARALFRAYRALERQAIRRAEAVVTVSDGVATMLEEHYAVRPTVIPNCHDERLDAPEAVPLQTWLDLGTDCFLLVMVGNSNDGVAVDAAVRSLSRLPSSVHLALLGDRHGEQMLELANASSLGDRVHLIPPVHPTAVVPTLRGADAMLIALIPKEGQSPHALPNKIYQGLAAGLPILYSPELVEIANVIDGTGIEIDPADPDSIARGVRKLLISDDRERHARAAATLGSMVGWDRQERRLYDLVAGILGDRVHPPR